MLNDPKEAIFALSKNLTSLNIYSLILFGSVAKGTFRQDSDIDILVLLDTEIIPTPEEEKKVMNVIFDIESKFDVHVQVIISNKNFVKLDKFFVQHVLNEGTVLYSKSPQLKIQDLSLKPYVLINFIEKNLSPAKRMQLKRILYGYRSFKKIGKKKYTSYSKGLLEKINGIRIRSGVIFVSSGYLDKILPLLDKFKVSHYEHNVWMYA